MNAFAWRDSFNIGHKELDSDHRKFFDLLNDCYLSSCLASSGRVDPDLIHRIKEYAAMHFSYEEQVMRAIGFPDFAEHEKRHRYFEERIAGLEQADTRDDLRGFESMFSFLLDWFLNHVLEEDMKYGPYVRNHGGSIER